ncbi:MAG: TonB-dependent receptor [Bacteroidales bacterium]|jgi:iron complex outermembrane receptor protein|nr:TonB-dependent receptor [Bacteroidales bacterium]
MKRQVITGLVCLLFAMQISAQHILSGHVSMENSKPLDGASVVIVDLNIGTITNEDGSFSLNNIPDGKFKIQVSFLGYETVSKRVSVNSSMDLGVFLLKEQYYKGEEVTISALRAGKKTPMAYTNISKDEIAEQNFGKDIPYILSLTPSVITSSDAGHGIGYTSMRIRGTDANRINVTINGVPLNDAESHSVFWVDLPELASSTEQIQIQRGVGTSTNGAAAFGATVNMQTNLLSKEAYANYGLTAGSFNTLRNTVSAGTGLIKDKFAVDVRLSDLHSDGYIDRSWTDLQSYYLSASYYGEKSSLKFITFGGFEELYQSWGGVPSYMLSTDRTYNEMGEYTDSSGQTAYYDNQVDHYDQVHYQLHYSKEFSSRLVFNAALHYTKGNGYYEQYKDGEDHADYSMEYPVVGSDTVFNTDLVRRKWLDNDFYGAIASLKYDAKNSTAILGGGLNKYDGSHFGKVIWAQYFGDNIPGHEWYRNSGEKTDWNIYSKYYYYLNDRLTAFGDLQMRAINHRIVGNDDDNRDITQEHSFLFFNPKAGINFEPQQGHRSLLSYARANREPNRSNYTDAPTDNMPVHETLNDFEAGYSVSGKNYKAGLTLYFMDYKNQLVLTGEINDVGSAIMTNVPDSYRAGAEFEFAYSYFDKIKWSANLSLSKNKIRDYVNYIDNWDYWYVENAPFQIEEEIGNSTLAYSPSIVASSLLEYNLLDAMTFSLTSKYVGKQFIDNSSNVNYMLSAYFVSDLKVSYTLNPEWAESISLSVIVPNILDVKYETNAWLYRYYSEGIEGFYDGYYPQAGRYVLLGLNVRF